MNYKSYRLSFKECIRGILIYVCISSIIMYLFYDSYIAVIISSLFLPAFLAYRSRELAKGRIKYLRLQFVSMIESLSSALTSGLSVSNAFSEALNDMTKLYGDSSLIAIEIKEIIRMQELNISTTECIDDFAHRSGIEDIEDFSVIFSEAQLSGGNLNEIIKDCVTIIEEKIRLEEEIETMLKGKIMEQKVMSIVPFFIIAYLRITSKSFMSALYGNPFGITVMTGCLFIYIIAFIIAQKIIRIQV